MKIGFIIPARIKSTRLKNKILITLKDRTVLEHVIKRAEKVYGVDEIVVTTSWLPDDKPVIDIAFKNGKLYYIGNPVDVLRRVTDTVNYFKYDCILTITPDNPLFSIEASLELVKLCFNKEIGFAKFTGMPIGTSPIMVKAWALNASCEIKKIIGFLDTEIWGDLFNNKLFKPYYLKAIRGQEGNFRLTLDTYEDLILIKKLYDMFYNVKDDIVDLYSVIEYIKNNPEILNIISQIKQRQLEGKIKRKIENLFSNNYTEIQKIIEDFQSGRRLYYNEYGHYE